MSEFSHRASLKYHNRKTLSRCMDGNLVITQVAHFHQQESSTFSLGLFLCMCVSNIFRICQHALSLIQDWKVELRNMTWIQKWQLSRSEPNIKEDRALFLFTVLKKDIYSCNEGSILGTLIPLLILFINTIIMTRRSAYNFDYSCLQNIMETNYKTLFSA